MKKNDLKELLDCSVCEYSLYEDGCPDCKMKKLALKTEEETLKKVEDFLSGFIIPCAQKNLEFGCLRLDGGELREMLIAQFKDE